MHYHYADQGYSYNNLNYNHVFLLRLYQIGDYYQGFFCDGTRRYGVPAPFFQNKEKKIFVMYIITE